MLIGGSVMGFTLRACPRRAAGAGGAEIVVAELVPEVDRLGEGPMGAGFFRPCSPIPRGLVREGDWVGQVIGGTKIKLGLMHHSWSIVRHRFPRRRLFARNFQMDRA